MGVFVDVCIVVNCVNLVYVFLLFFFSVVLMVMCYVGMLSDGMCDVLW